MATSVLPVAIESAPPEAVVQVFIPPLENGDRLTRAEFERRYEAMPHVRKAELIEGEVHMPSPVRANRHGMPHGDFMGLLAVYRYHTPGVRVADNTTIRLDMENEEQPDGLLLIEQGCGGRIRIDEDDYINGGPELAAEIAASSVSIDLGKKLRVYRRNEVQEYIVWRVQDKAIDWFYWLNGVYERIQPDGDGISKSRVLPGFWLDTAAILQGEFARADTVLRRGLDSPEHQAFVAKLRGK